jgi:hypothetical protein
MHIMFKESIELSTIVVNFSEQKLSLNNEVRSSSLLLPKLFGED